MHSSLDRTVVIALSKRTREGSKMTYTSLGTAMPIVVLVAATCSHADERCHQLDTLRAQYAGVQLTPDQAALKIKLVAWYVAHCGKHEVARWRARLRLRRPTRRGSSQVYPVALASFRSNTARQSAWRSRNPQR